MRSCADWRWRVIAKPGWLTTAPPPEAAVTVVVFPCASGNEYAGEPPTEIFEDATSYTTSATTQAHSGRIQRNPYSTSSRVINWSVPMK